ncbi:hypothetical protein LEP1GSC037_3330 [Leptospira interrogans str. 2006001854]|uniref:TraB domain protein n=1 Tax=Leptospira interrogans str. 2006001854 TaxID=1001590 RepID=M6G897_LEPIR|nr:hypothetical protein LEP1GSC037_3330 [Leptospira interrogans str. 2006001854]
MAKVILKDKTKPERKKVSKSQEPFETFKLGKTNVTILGTAHISQKSIDEVQRIIRKENRIRFVSNFVILEYVL